MVKFILGFLHRSDNSSDMSNTMTDDKAKSKNRLPNFKMLRFVNITIMIITTSSLTGYAIHHGGGLYYMERQDGTIRERRLLLQGGTPKPTSDDVKTVIEPMNPDPVTDKSEVVPMNPDPVTDKSMQSR